MRKILILFCANLPLSFLFSQGVINQRHKLFQISIVPALSTNGLNPGKFINHFSLNLTSGYSAGNKGIEIAAISNLNKEITAGLQFAGIANVTGADLFSGINKDQKNKKLEESFEANLSGAQFSGLSNIVVNNTFGLQFSGGFNVTKGSLFGVQVSGVSSVTQKYTFGVQLSGIYNSSVKAIDGVQIASILNYTSGRLQGVQIGGFNIAGTIEGKNSNTAHNSSGLQLGFINNAGKMNGVQIGLINLGGNMQGTQIGLINFYKPGGMRGTYNGTSIGLLNIGRQLNIKVHATEIFLLNYSISTGTAKNLRTDGFANTYIMNNIIFGYNPENISSDGSDWILGYGLTYMLFNRSDSPKFDEKIFGDLSLQIHYLNNSTNTSNLNLLGKIESNLGIQVIPAIPMLYFTAGISYNKAKNPIDFLFIKEKSLNKTSEWLGFQFGLLIH